MMSDTSTHLDDVMHGSPTVLPYQSEAEKTAQASRKPTLLLVGGSSIASDSQPAPNLEVSAASEVA